VGGPLLCGPKLNHSVRFVDQVRNTPPGPVVRPTLLCSPRVVAKVNVTPPGQLAQNKIRSAVVLSVLRGSKV